MCVTVCVVMEMADRYKANVIAALSGTCSGLVMLVKDVFLANSNAELYISSTLATDLELPEKSKIEV